MRFFCSLAASLALLIAGGCQGLGKGRSDDARLRAAAAEPDQWLMDGGGYAGWHYSALDQITLANVSRLKPAWFFELDTTRGQEAEPVVVDGVMYLSTAWSKVYALDAAGGRLLWHFDPHVAGEVGAKACCDVVNRGVAVYRGLVYLGALDGRLIALDARDGRVRWSVQTTDPQQMYTITGAPRIVRGKVIIGNAGAEFGVRGFVSAYDAATGRLVWRFYTVPGDPARGADGAASDEIMDSLVRPTWSGEWWKYGGGGTVWNAITYDPELNLVYIGTGNGAPWNHRFRSAGRGDNLFLCSIIALDPDTGRYRWHYQLNPAESWDYNATMPMILASLRLQGAQREVLLQAPKNGFFYVLDRRTGKLLSAEPFVDGITWASRIDLTTGRPVEAVNARYEQGPFRLSPWQSGAHNWHPMAYSPRTGWVYFSAVEASVTLASEATFEPLPPPVDSVGVEVSDAGVQRRYLQAWDPVANKAVWRQSQPALEQGGGVLATGGGLIFQGLGAVAGAFAAYRDDSGERVWSHRLPNAPIAAPVSYRIDGVQYVAVLTGQRGAGGGAGGPQPLARQFGRVVAFKLDGMVSTPAEPPAAAPANPSAEVWPAAFVARGERRYARLCGRCHGPGTRSANVVPDLRRAGALADPDAWRAIVLDGALAAAGMVGWRHVLSDTDSEAIRAYVSTQALLLQSQEGNRRQ